MTRDTVGSDLLVEAVARRPTWQISARAFDVLVRMCLTALDKPKGTNPGRLYFGGWVPLAMMLGYDAPGEGETLSPAADRAVWRAITELVDAGLIKRVDPETQKEYRYAAYRITF